MVMFVFIGQRTQQKVKKGREEESSEQTGEEGRRGAQLRPLQGGGAARGGAPPAAGGPRAAGQKVSSDGLALIINIKHICFLLRLKPIKRKKDYLRLRRELRRRKKRLQIKIKSPKPRRLDR